MKRLALAAAAMLALASPAPAWARLLQVTLTGTFLDNNNGNIDPQPEYASFLIDENPAILSNNFAIGEGFRVKNLAGVFHFGTDDTYLSYLQDVEFVSGDGGGGFFTLFPTDKTGAMGTILNVAANLYGPGEALYAGPESSPTIRTGTFTVYDVFDGSPLSLVVAEAPEPVTWASLTIGLLLVGTAIRRQRRPAAATAAASA